MPQPHTRYPPPAQEFGHGRAGEYGHAMTEACCGGPGPAQLVARLLGGERSDGDAGAPQGGQGRVADRFGADDDRAGADPLSVQVDGLLKLAGGEHSGGPCAGYEACAARAFACPGGEDDGARGDAFEPVRAGDVQGEGPRPSGGGDPRPYACAGAERGLDGPGRVLRPRHAPPPEPAVVAVPRHAARHRLTLQDLHDTRPVVGEAAGGREPGGPRADDDHVDAPLPPRHAGPHSRRPSWSSRTAAPQ